METTDEKEWENKGYHYAEENIGSAYLKLRLEKPDILWTRQANVCKIHIIKHFQNMFYPTCFKNNDKLEHDAKKNQMPIDHKVFESWSIDELLGEARIQHWHLLKMS